MFQRLSWATAAVVVATLAGCGLFSDNPDDDPFDISIKQDVSIDFAIDDEMLCPPTEDCDAPTAPSPGPIDLPTIAPPGIEVDVLELTQNDDLAKASNRLKKVEIESVDYAIAPNTLNIPGPTMRLYVAPLNATSHEASGAAYIGEIPAAAPQTEATGTVVVSDADKEKVSELFKSLKFKVFVRGDKDIENGEMFPPQGRSDYELTFNLRFTANPTEQF